MTAFADLDEAVDAINRGHVWYYLLKPCQADNLLQVLRNAREKYLLERNRDQLVDDLHKLNTELEKRVEERTRELQEANRLLAQRKEELERLVLIDPLTELFNRRAAETFAEAEVRRHNRYLNPLSIGVLDVDYFKQINTDFDLPGGDEALQALAKMLSGSLREVDTVGRLGGEEFLIIARETNAEGAAALAERIRQTVAATPIEIGGHPISITVSVGFAVAEDQPARDFQQMYHLAAAALSAAKREGRNRSVIRLIDGPEEPPARTRAAASASAVPPER